MFNFHTTPIELFAKNSANYAYSEVFSDNEKYKKYLKFLVDEYSSNLDIIKSLDTVDILTYEVMYHREYIDRIVDRAERLFNANSKSGRKKSSVFVNKIKKKIASIEKKNKKTVDSYNKNLELEKKKMIKYLERENKLLKDVALKLEKIRISPNGDSKDAMRKKYGY